MTKLVTYVDGAPTGEEEEVGRLTVIRPVAEQLQVGTRALDASFVSGSSYGGLLIWPAVGADNINSDYAWRWGKLHAALDIGSKVGTSLGKTVVAAAEGTVVISGVHSSYGYYVKIDHGNGMQTLYAHCMAGSLLVNVGDHVDAGTPIAKVGMTGYATGPHLHFEVIINGVRVDPKPYLGI
ncbi:MAG: M23 family metallopeptidase [Clostridia bacterium]|nr:M23 family metallopeptidase [Clostridia bacterium]